MSSKMKTSYVASATGVNLRAALAASVVVLLQVVVLRHDLVPLRPVILFPLLVAKPNFSAAERRSDLPALADEQAALPQADSVMPFWFLMEAGELEASLSVESPEAGLTQFDCYYSPAADLCLAASMCQTRVALRPVDSYLALSVRWT